MIVYISMICIFNIAIVTALSRIPGDLLEFQLLRADCLKSSFPDSNSQHLVGTLNPIAPVSCLNSNGISNFAISSGNISRMLLRLSPESVTFELWIYFNSSAIRRMTADKEIMKICSRDQMDCVLKVMLTPQRVLYTKYIASGNELSIGKNGVNVLRISDTSIVHHLTVTVGYASTSAFGVTTYLNQVSYMLDGLYNASTMKNVALSSSGPWGPNVWPAKNFICLLSQNPVSTIYLLSLHSMPLQAFDVLNNYQAGLPNSVPVTGSTSVAIGQNGEAGDHSSTPEFYLTPIPSNDLAYASLTMVDFDNQKMSPNYNRTKGSKSYPVLLSLPDPSKCILYNMSGSPLVAGTAIAWDASLSIFGVRIRPARNQYSSSKAQCSFQFFGIDGTTLQRSIENSTVTVFVQHINQPPVTTCNTKTTFAGKGIFLQLTGTDVDGTIATATIKSLPSNGQLYQVYENGTQYPYPIQLTSAVRVTNSQRKVYYVFRNSASLSSSFNSDGSIASDSFQFFVTDNGGRFSVTCTQALTIFPSLQAYSSAPNGKMLSSSDSPSLTTPLVRERIITSIALYGSDVSNAGEPMFVKILSLPSRGCLYTNAIGSVQVAVGNQFAFSSGGSATASSLLLYYLGPKDYFTVPSVSWNGSALPPALNLSPDLFTFQIGGQYSNIGLQYSAPATQVITVQNVNSRTDLTFNYYDSFKDGKIEILAFSGMLQPDKNNMFDVATIDGFSVVDDDYDTGLVVVHVTTALGGLVSLNRRAIDYIDYSSTHFCQTSTAWTCVGPIYFTSEMIFVAAPSVVAMALNGMTYQSTIPGILDTINITIYDGEGGWCLLDDVQSPLSYRDGCYSSSASIQVRVRKFDAVSTKHVYEFRVVSMDYRIKIIMFGILIIVLLCLIRCCVVCCRKRGKDDGESEEGDRKQSARSRLGLLWETLACMCCAAKSSATRPRRKARSSNAKASTKKDDQFSETDDDIELGQIYLGVDDNLPRSRSPSKSVGRSRSGMVAESASRGKPELRSTHEKPTKNKSSNLGPSRQPQKHKAHKDFSAHASRQLASDDEGSEDDESLSLGVELVNVNLPTRKDRNEGRDMQNRARAQSCSPIKSAKPTRSGKSSRFSEEAITSKARARAWSASPVRGTSRARSANVKRQFDEYLSDTELENPYWDEYPKVDLSRANMPRNRDHYQVAPAQPYDLSRVVASSKTERNNASHKKRPQENTRVCDQHEYPSNNSPQKVKANLDSLREVRRNHSRK